MAWIYENCDEEGIALLKDWDESDEKEDIRNFIDTYCGGTE